MNERGRVVIAERRAPLSLRLKDIVEKAGFEAVVAYSGQVALSQARATHPDLLVLSDDIGPPGPSETARRIREDPATRTIPIVILATTPEESEALAKAYPVDACLPVTTDPVTLVKCIRLLAGGPPRRTKNGQRVGPLEGTLQGNLLSELLEFLFLTQKAGRVEITDGERSKGSIYLEGGKVVHAEFNRARGQEAFNQVCFLKRGYFKFEPGVRASETTMRHDGVGLLLEAAKQLDDRRRARETDGRPAPAPNARAQLKGGEPEPRTSPLMGVMGVMGVMGTLVEVPRSQSQAPPQPQPDLPRTKIEGVPNAGSAIPTLKPEPLAASTHGSTSASGRFRPAVTAHSASHLFPQARSGGLARLLQWRRPAAAASVVAAALVAAFFLGRNFPLLPEEAVSQVQPAPALPWEGDRFDVSIESEPVGARVQIDGQDVGLTPVPGLSLKPGSYLLRLQKNGFQPLQREMLVTSEKSTHGLKFELPPLVSTDQATLILRVVPAGASVFVDGQRLAPSSGAPKFDPGPHRVEVKANGFENWSGQVALDPGATRELAVTLQRLKATSELEAAAPGPEPAAPEVELPVVDPVRISGDFPTYPKTAREQKMKGSVLVEIEVDELGSVGEVKVLESAGFPLDQAVLSAIKTWKYQPATQGGTAVRAFVKSRHTFR